jgi:ATP-dependent DNA helicase 2 subunit 1
MSFWEKTEEEEEENQDEEDEFKNVNDRIIFLIDARNSMSEKNQKGETHMLNCLKVALEVMKTKIIAQDNSSVGITFFGTREKDSVEGTDGLFALLPLAPPSAERIRKLKVIIDDTREFELGIGSQATTKKFCPLKQALWYCSQSFATKDMKKTDFKRIWLFTNDDNPNSHSIMEQKAIVTVARDCAQAGIEISLWHLNPRNDVFNPRIFYFQLLVDPSGKGGQTDDDELESSIDNRMLSGGFDGFDALMASVRRKEYRKRRLGGTLFALGRLAETEREAAEIAAALPQAVAMEELNNNNNKENNTKAAAAASGFPTAQLHMSIHIYKTVQIVKKPAHSWLYAGNNEPLKSVSNFYNSGTGEVLPTEQIETYIEVAGTRVLVEKEEMKTLKKKNNIPFVGIRLLYFLPAAFLKEDMNVETPYFLYPDEKTVKGSSALFESLLRSCAKKNVYPIVRFNLTASSNGRIGVLVPQLEIIDENDGCQVQPPGFHLLYLPFAEDIRFCPILDPIATAPQLSEKISTSLKKIVESLSLSEDFNYSREIENPCLKAYYATLQAIALNEDELEWQAEKDDKLNPPEEMMEKASEEIEEFKKLIDYDEEEILASVGTKVS